VAEVEPYIATDWDIEKSWLKKPSAVFFAMCSIISALGFVPGMYLFNRSTLIRSSQLYPRNDLTAFGQPPLYRLHPQEVEQSTRESSATSSTCFRRSATEFDPARILKSKFLLSLLIGRSAILVEVRGGSA
jgi:hypothetical protein